MNVKANDLVRLMFDKPTFVPLAPGHSGLPVDAAWSFHPPPLRPSMNLAYRGGLFHADYPLSTALCALVDAV